MPRDSGHITYNGLPLEAERHSNLNCVYFEYCRTNRYDRETPTGFSAIISVPHTPNYEKSRERKCGHLAVKESLSQREGIRKKYSLIILRHSRNLCTIENSRDLLNECGNAQ